MSLNTNFPDNVDYVTLLLFKDLNDDEHYSSFKVEKEKAFLSSVFKNTVDDTGVEDIPVEIYSEITGRAICTWFENTPLEIMREQIVEVHYDEVRCKKMFMAEEPEHLGKEYIPIMIFNKDTFKDLHSLTNFAKAMDYQRLWFMSIIQRKMILESCSMIENWHLMNSINVGLPIIPFDKKKLMEAEKKRMELRATVMKQKKENKRVIVRATAKIMK